MTKQPIPPLIDFFKDIKDPRIERNKAYPLIEVADYKSDVITLLAVMARTEGPMPRGGRISKNTAKRKKHG